VIFEELVDELADHGRRFHLLCGYVGFSGQRFGLDSLEAEVDFCDSFLRQFNQRGILDDAGKQSFSFAVRRGWIISELFEVYGHQQQPLTNSIVQDELVLLSCVLSLLSRLNQRTQFLVPFCLEGVGNQAIAGIDQHESALRQIGFELRTLDCAAARPISILLPTFDLSPDLERQLDSGRRHPLDHERPDGPIDRWSGD
jgi:hypothetical protein